MKSKRSAITIAFLAILGVGLLALQRNTGAPATDTQPPSTATPNATFTVGEKAPDFTSVDFDGNTIKLSDFAGKAVVIDFWAAWCPFCVEELPELEKIHQETKDDVVFLGIHRTDSGESIERGKEFADDKGVTYTLVQDPTKDIYKMATKGLDAMPTAVYIDKNGIVQEIKLGPKTEDDIRNAVQNIL